MKHRGGSLVGNVLEKALAMLPHITHVPNPICSTGLNVDSLAGIQVKGYKQQWWSLYVPVEGL